MNRLNVFEWLLYVTVASVLLFALWSYGYHKGQESKETIQEKMEKASNTENLKQSRTFQFGDENLPIRRMFDRETGVVCYTLSPTSTLSCLWVGTQGMPP